MANTIKTILLSYPQRLNGISDTVRLDVECLLCHVLNVSKSYLYTWSEKQLTQEQLYQFNRLFDERLQGKPVAYLTGKQGFWNLELIVNEHTLIPRADTEVLIDAILNRFANASDLTVLDLGTGSGAIALALANSKPSWNVIAVDNCLKALTIAKENAQRHGIDNVTFLCGSWYQPLANESFDIIVSNPPYIDKNDQALCDKVRQYEPNNALIANNNGLADIAHIITHGKCYLKPSGFMIIEHGYQQAKDVAELFKQYSYTDVLHYYDLAHHKRATSANAEILKTMIFR